MQVICSTFPPPTNVGMQKMCDERKRRNLNLHFPTFFILHADQDNDKKKSHVSE